MVPIGLFVLALGRGFDSRWGLSMDLICEIWDLLKVSRISVGQRSGGRTIDGAGKEDNSEANGPLVFSALVRPRFRFS